MSYNNQFFQRAAPQASTFETIFSFKDVSPKTQDHLYRVYSLLAVTCLTCVAGMYCNATFIMSGFFSTLVSILLSGYLIF